MTTHTDGEFNGMPCRWLENGTIKLAVTTSQGPKIVFWGYKDGSNIFVELPNATIPTPMGEYNLLGGHRLWYAPERIETTYWPDINPVEVTDIPGGAIFTAPADGHGIAKEMVVTLSPDGPEVRVNHIIRNTGEDDVVLAPWAISMCRQGGVALLPQPLDKVDPGGFLPNRQISLWPYTDINDPRILLSNRIALIKPTPGPNNKIGYRNVAGWFAYWLDGTLFTKHSDPQLAGQHPDQNSNAEFFFSQDVIELETLAPLVTLAPNTQTTHEEVWRLYPAPNAPATEQAAIDLATSLNL